MQSPQNASGQQQQRDVALLLLRIRLSQDLRLMVEMVELVGQIINVEQILWGAISSKAFSITLLNLANSSMSAFSLALPADGWTALPGPAVVPVFIQNRLDPDNGIQDIRARYSPQKENVNLSISKI